MTDYKNIKGKRIKFLTSDLSTAEAEGQVFYSDTDAEFKVAVASAVWSSSASMLTARYGAAGGIQTAAFIAGGYTTAETNVTEEYDGTGFSVGGNINTARTQMGGLGTQTAGLIAGGFDPPSVGITEEYNGSAWTESGDLNVERRTAHGTAGTQTAGLFFGGYRDITPTPNGAMNSSESYNGSAWTAEPALNSACWGGAGDGTATAALSVGGPPVQTEVYDGSSWTTDVNINTARLYPGAAGTTTAMAMFGGTTDGGDPGNTGATEIYDGTTWTETGDLGTARRFPGPAGTKALALSMGGFGPAAKGNTEEFNITAMTVTQGTWSSGTNHPAAVTLGGYAGTQTASVFMGGQPNPRAVTTEWDGSAFSTGGAMPGGMYNAAAFGIQTAAVVCGGYYEPGNANDKCFEYNGSSWTDGGDLATGTYLHGCAGTLAAGLAVAGHTDNYVQTQEYDGTNWTNVPGDLNTGRRNLEACGTQTAALACAGYTPEASPDFPLSNESYDGSSWTEVADLATARSGGGLTFNSVTATICAGGTTGSYQTITEEWTVPQNVEVITD